MASIDYTQIQDDLAALLLVNVTDAANIFTEGMDREVGNLSNMPCLNVRLIESNVELTSMPDSSYERVNYIVDVVAFDFTSFRNAARIRDGLLRTAMAACRANRAFSAGITTSSVQSQVTFGASEIQGQQGHVAMASFSVLVEAYVEP